MGKPILLLNGPSSSGKSTLSRVLQALIREQKQETYAIVSIDDFMKLATDETIYEDDVYEISGDMCAAALKALETASGVILDHVITSPRIYSQLNELLGRHSIHRIHVTCPLPVLLQREFDRKNRCLGSAEASFTYLFPQEGYDLTVDTSAGTSQECARKILETFL